MPLDRSQHTILVPAAQSMGGIGAIRSLGRAGYRVVATSHDPRALGLRSRYATDVVVHPQVGDPAFGPFIDQVIADKRIEMIVPGGGIGYSEHGALAKHRHLIPSSTEPAIRARGATKYQLFDTLTRAGGMGSEHLPPTLVVDLDATLPTLSDLETLGTPIYIKLDQELARGQGQSAVIVASSASDALERLKSVVDLYRGAVVQGFVPGRGAGAYLLRWDDRVLARAMHLRMHEVPHTGGASSLRRTFWHEAMMADAVAKLDLVGWRGVAMVEYRWDVATNRFWLMEMNLRFWGSLHLSLFAGVDFPRLWADAFFGEPSPGCVDARLGVVSRNTLPYEVNYLKSLWGDRQVPVGRKLYAAAEAAWLTLDPRIHDDLRFPGDRALFGRRLAAWLGLKPAAGPSVRLPPAVRAKRNPDRTIPGRSAAGGTDTLALE